MLAEIEALRAAGRWRSPERGRPGARAGAARAAVVEADGARIGCVHAGPRRAARAPARSLPGCVAVVVGHSHIPLLEVAPTASPSSTRGARPMPAGAHPHHGTAEAAAARSPSCTSSWAEAGGRCRPGAVRAALLDSSRRAASGAWSTCSVTWSTAKRSRSTRCRRRCTAWQSSSGRTSTWAASAGKPDVTSRRGGRGPRRRPARRASASPIASTSMPAGRPSRTSVGRAQQRRAGPERSAPRPAATRRGRPGRAPRRGSQPGGRGQSEETRSATTWAIAPSTFRLRRCAREIAHAVAPHDSPDRRPRGRSRRPRRPGGPGADRLDAEHASEHQQRDAVGLRGGSRPVRARR